MPCHRCGEWAQSYCWIAQVRPSGTPDPDWLSSFEDPEERGEYWLLACSPSCQATILSQQVDAAEEVILGELSWTSAGFDIGEKRRLRAVIIEQLDRIRQLPRTALWGHAEPANLTRARRHLTQGRASLSS